MGFINQLITGGHHPVGNLIINYGDFGVPYYCLFNTHPHLQPNGFGATGEHDMKGYIHAKTSRAKLPAVGINNFSAYVTSLLNEMSSHQIVSSYTIYDLGL